MLSLQKCNKAKVGAYAIVSPFSEDLLGDSRMSKLLDKSFIHRSYPKLACGSIHAQDLKSEALYTLFGTDREIDRYAVFSDQGHLSVIQMVYYSSRYFEVQFFNVYISW